MKTLISIFAVALALAFSVPAFAQTIDSAKTKADCEKAAAFGVGEIVSAASNRL